MHTLPDNTDACLLHAHQQWAPLLHRGLQYYASGSYSQALPALSEAIRISASFHPLFHFLESGLNTALAQYCLKHEQWHEAAAAFDRAIFLHHDNATALAGKTLITKILSHLSFTDNQQAGAHPTTSSPLTPHPTPSPNPTPSGTPPTSPASPAPALPPYNTLHLSAALTPPATSTGIHALYRQAQQAERLAAPLPGIHPATKPVPATAALSTTSDHASTPNSPPTTAPHPSDTAPSGTTPSGTTPSGTDPASLYRAAIHQCETTHQLYHQLAALPWLARARCFAAQGEDMLARNDIRRGMDLDRHNPDLLTLSLDLAS